MPTTTIHSPTFPDSNDQALVALRRGFGHRSSFDAPLINAAAHSILAAGQKAKTILEICCGYGELLSGLAEAFPDAQVTGMDQFPGTVETASKQITNTPNARVLAHDVMHLDSWDDNSVDMIIGQATLHHLTHNPNAALNEFYRVLRPEGKCLFTFEPLSHNHLVNTVRAYRNASKLLIDESNLYISTVEGLATKFSSVEVQCYNLSLSFLFKILPPISPLLKLATIVRWFDSKRFQIFPLSLRKAANMNVIFTK